MQTAVTVVNLIHDITTEMDRPVCWVFPACSWRECRSTSGNGTAKDPERTTHIRIPASVCTAGYLPYAQWAALPAAEKAKHWTLKRGWKLVQGAVPALTEAEYAKLEKTHLCCPAAPSTKPVFEPPDGWKYRTDGVQMELKWRPDFGAEKTAALQKAQYALAQEAAKLIDSYVPFDTGTLKNSVNQASNFKEGLLVYNTPYARRQYYLHEQGTCLHGETGLRGSYWGQRALADIGEHLALYGARAVTTFWGGMGHL